MQKAIGLRVTGLPSGATATFSSTSVTPSGSSTMTIRTTSTATRGTFSVHVVGTGGGSTHEVVVSLTVS